MTSSTACSSPCVEFEKGTGHPPGLSHPPMLPTGPTASATGGCARVLERASVPDREELWMADIGEPSWEEGLTEFGRRQNPYAVRDRLPHPVDVKSLWLAMKADTGPVDFDDVGFSVFSQNNEDGILLHLFSRIGFTSRKSIEIGCNIDNTTLGVPEGNSVNLILNFGFHGLIIDMEAAHIAGLHHFFASCFATRHFHHAVDVAPMQPSGSGDFYSPVLVRDEVTPENIDRILGVVGFTGDVDLLSLDIDGNDVRVLQAMEAAIPRVLVVEVNSRLPFESQTFAGPIPDWELHPSTTSFRQSSGSSLAFMCAAVEAKGYVFVGMNNILINAFFLRADVFANSGLPARSLSDYVDHRFRPPESRG